MSETPRDESELGESSVAGSIAESEARVDETDEAGVLDGPRGVRLTGRRKGSPRRRRRAMVLPETTTRPSLTPEQRMLILDAWRRSGLGAHEFGTIVQVSGPTLYAWRRRFESLGPEGLSDRPRGRVVGSRLGEAARRAILLLKESHPDWGSDRIHAMLLRGEGFAASPGAILRVLREAGYESTV